MSATTFSRFQDGAHNLFRVGVGFLFWQHGAQKLFGWFGGTQVELMSQMGLAGVLEFFGGILIVIGLLTRPVAIVLALEMVVAYLQAHAGQALMPIQNGGELPLLYLVSYLLLATMGPGSFSVDARRTGGERSAIGDAGAPGGGAGGAGAGVVAGSAGTGDGAPGA